MSSPISPIAMPTAAIAPVASPGQGSGLGVFQSILGDAIGKVQAFQQGAADSVNQFLSGEGGEVHTAALAVERAELAFDMFLQVRNKVVSAYQEIMRTQL